MPIQVGASLTDKRFKGMLQDDNGSNISYKNKSYCELTAQYWAWKNLDSDYYGFCHYRRYFDFKTEHNSEYDWGITEIPEINEEAIQKFGWDEDSIRQCVEGYDIITAPIVHINETIYEQYANAFKSFGIDLKIEDLDCVLNILREKYPDYYPYAEKFFNGHKWCWANMYILKKKIFFDYCEWIFDILEEFEKRTDMSNYSVQCLRTPGHLAERLFNVYLLHYLDNNEAVKWKSIARVDIQNTSIKEMLYPAFEKNNIAIAIPSSNYYSPITGVLLKSIVDNSSKDNNYDVLIIEDCIEDSQKALMKSIIRDADNFSLRFIDIKKQLCNLCFKLKEGYTIHTYFRLLLPELLEEYEKVLYLDADTIVNADLAELYNTELGDNLIGAVRDIRMAMWYGLPGAFQKSLLDNQLKMKNPYDYFQGGVLLFNLKKFRSELPTKYLCEVAASQYWDCLDQDVLNYLCQGKTLYLDMSWNVMIKWPIQPSEIYAPVALFEAYKEAHARPKIIHYAGAYPSRQLPCFTANVDLAEYFWRYARLTPFYERLLGMFIESTASRIYNELHSHVRPKEALWSKIKRKLIMPIVNRLLPYGSQRRNKAKKAYYKLRGRSC